MFVLLYLGCTTGQTGQERCFGKLYFASAGKICLYLWPNVSSDTICRKPEYDRLLSIKHFRHKVVAALVKMGNQRQSWHSKRGKVQKQFQKIEMECFIVLAKSWKCQTFKRAKISGPFSLHLGLKPEAIWPRSLNWNWVNHKTCSYFWNQFFLTRKKTKTVFYAQLEENLELWEPRTTRMHCIAIFTHCFPTRTWTNTRVEEHSG